MTAARPYGVRPSWSQLPPAVHDWVSGVLGGPVVAADSQPGGFSPGTADRVVTADGRRAFVKAVSSTANPHSPGLHRREADVLRSLSGLAVAPDLLGTRDNGDWVVLALEDVDGRHPHTPWTSAELGATMAALQHLAHHRAPASWPRLEEELVAEFGCWLRLADEPPPGLDGWAMDNAAAFAELARRTLPRLAGDSIAHSDVRSDNLLVEPGGDVRLVDWPWASRGAAWFDVVSLLVNVRLYGDLDVTPYLPLARDLGATEEDVAGTIAGLGGFCLWQGSRPPAPGLPTLRAFQLAQGRACLKLLRELGA